MLGHEDLQNKMQQAATFVTEENLANEYAQKGEVFEENRQESVSKAKQDNELIGFSLKNADALNLDVSKKARLSSIKGRNLSIILLNSPDYDINSPTMQKVKETVAAVEDAITKPVKEFLHEEDNKERFRVTLRFADIGIIYQDAIAACNHYLADKKNMSPSGVDRYNMIKEKRDNLLAEKQRLSMAQQLFHRKAISPDNDFDVTIKDLLLQEREYTAQNHTVTKEELEEFKKKKVINRSFYYTDNEISERHDFKGGKNGLKFVCNTLTQKFLPDAMLKELGDKPEDKEKAIRYIKTIFQTISNIPEGKLYSKSMVIDDIVVNLFQLEDGSLDIAYDYKVKKKDPLDPDKENEFVYSRHHNLSSSTKTIVSSMAANIVEHEDVFGPELVQQIIGEIGETEGEKDIAKRYGDNDIASAYIRSKLGINNIALTNVSHEDKIKLAKDIANGTITKEAGLEYLENYEYGGKAKKLEKDRKKKAKMDKIQKDLNDLDSIAQDYGYANMEEYIKAYKDFTEYPAESIEYENRLIQGMNQEQAEVNKRIEEIDLAYKKTIQFKLDERAELEEAYNKAVAKGTTVYNTRLERFYAESDEKTVEMMGRKSALEAQWAEQSEVIKRSYAGKTSAKDKKEMQKALSDLEAQFTQRGKEIEDEWGQWAKAKEQELNALSQQVSQGWEEEYKKITDIDADINLLQNTWAQDVDKILGDFRALNDKARVEYTYLDAWKEYYKNCKLAGVKELLDFSDWKEKFITLSLRHDQEWKSVKVCGEWVDNLVQLYRDAKDDYEILENADTSLTATHVNGGDTLSLLQHRKNMEEAGLLKDKVIFEEEEKKEKKEEKKEYDPKTMWSDLELKLKDFVSEFIYSEKTWEMDMTAENPGKRLFCLMSKNKQLLLTMVQMKQDELNNVIKGFVSKLPTAIMGMDSEQLSSILIDMTMGVKQMVKDETDRQIKEREEARELLKDQKRWEIVRKENPGKAQEVLDAEFKKLKEYKKSLFHFFESDEEKARRLAMEAKLDAVENAAKDGLELQDMALKGQTAENILRLAIGFIFPERIDENDEDTKSRFDMFSRYENDLNEMMKVSLQSMKETMKDFVEENFGDAEANQEEIEKVPFYRNEKNIENRKKLEQKGDEQLLKMIKNSAAGKTGQGQYIRNVFAEYLPGCSVLDLKSMLASALRNAKPSQLSENPSEEEKFKAVSSYVGGLFKGAGPLFQKILQGLPGQMIPKGLEEAFEDVKCNLAPIPKEIVEAEMLSIIERSAGKIQKINIVKSLGAASIGQAFLCNVYDNEGSKKEVVIKLLRPDARNRMLREEKILRKCAEGAGQGMLKTFEGQMIHLKEELDLTIEAKNCELGTIYNSADGKVKSMKVSRMAPATPNAMMLERAPGDTVVGVLKSSRALRDEHLKQFYETDEKGNIVHTDNDTIKLNIKKGTDTYEAKVALSHRLTQLQEQQKMLLDMCDSWVRQAIFGEGFYHGDLHAGNIMMDKNTLTVIDFGNCTKLSPEEQKKILNVMMAATAGDYDAFLDGFGSMLSEGSQDLFKDKKKELRSIFKEVMQLGTYTSSASRIGAALMKAQELGFELPASIYGFQQCQMRLQSTVDDFNNEIKELKSALEQLDDKKARGSLNQKENYLEIPRQTSYASQNTYKMTLLPEDDTDGILTKFIKAQTKEEQQKVLDYFEDSFHYINSFLSSPPDQYARTVYGYPGSEMTFFAEMISGFISREKYLEIINDGIISFVDYYGKEDGTKSFASQDPEVNKLRTEKIAALQEELKKYDVLALLKEYYKAQDDKLPKNQIDALEKNVIQGIIEAKKVYGKNKLDFIKKDIMNKNAPKPDATEQQKQASNEKILKAVEKESDLFDKKELFKEFRRDLKKPEKKEDMDTEISQYYSDPIYGEMIKTAYAEFNKAVSDNADERTLEQKIDKLIRAISGPLLLSFGTKSGNRQQRDNNYSKEEERNFFDVTGDVIGEEWKKALKKLGIGNSLSFGRKIASDIERKDIGRIRFFFRTMSSND